MIKLIERHSETFVNLDDVKSNLRVLHSDEDFLIQSYIDAACDYVQETTGRTLNSARYSETLPSIGENHQIVFSYIQSIDSIEYYDSTESLQSLDLSATDIDYGENCALISYDWPETFTRKDAVTITFTAGVPLSIAYPNNLKHAVILLASHWYENRTAAGQRLEDIPYGVEPLVNISKTGWF